MTTILGDDKRYEHDRKARKKYKLRIIYNKSGCTAAGHCVLSDPYNFKLDEEFKAILVDGTPHPTSKGVFVKEIETDEPHLVINAAKTCTPRVISIVDLETGKRIAP
ncbi:MAG: ferredoxin [Candidatus Aenigmarchaeota archaeon]|nr:ferredoxin [Candidatus Aenigmarchaeota archaeon]